MSSPANSAPLSPDSVGSLQSPQGTSSYVDSIGSPQDRVAEFLNGLYLLDDQGQPVVWQAFPETGEVLWHGVSFRDSISGKARALHVWGLVDKALQHSNSCATAPQAWRMYSNDNDKSSDEVLAELVLLPHGVECLAAELSRYSSPASPGPRAKTFRTELRRYRPIMVSPSSPTR